MNIKNAFGANEYNDDENLSRDNVDDRDADLGDLERKSKSRSRSRQLQPRQTKLAKSPTIVSKTKNQIDRSRNMIFDEFNKQGPGHNQSQSNLKLYNKSGLCSIEEVISNRHNGGQDLDQMARQQLFKNASQSRVADYAKNFASQSAQMRNTMSSFFQTSGFQKQMTQKLAYEWKNIYRALSNRHEDNLGIAKVAEFQKACAKSKIEFDKKELIKLVQHYGLQM